MTASVAKTLKNTEVDTIWFTRCPVPTATGLAYKLDWLSQEFSKDGITVSTLQETERQGLGRHHYDHELTTLIREGGNLLALGARAQGAPSRLIGLTWIDEWQAILVRADSGVKEPKDLKGLRLALPTWTEQAISENRRGNSIARGMSLHGYKGALAYAGLTLDDVTLVEVPSTRQGGRNNLHGLWAFDDLASGKVDALYVKGASAIDAAKQFGVVVGINLDKLPDRRYRVNNGTPRPITVHEDLLENHYELVVRFLEQTLRAADWARGNLEGVRKVLQSETRGSGDAVTEAYGEGFHTSLHPDLSAERLALFEQQKKFTWVHGFADADFDFDAWVEPGPLNDAYKRLSQAAA